MIIRHERRYVFHIAHCDACGDTKELSGECAEPTPLGWMRFGEEGLICNHCQVELLRDLAVQLDVMVSCQECDGQGRMNVNLSEWEGGSRLCSMCGGARVVIPPDVANEIQHDKRIQRHDHSRRSYCSPFIPEHHRPTNPNEPDPRNGPPA